MHSIPIEILNLLSKDSVLKKLVSTIQLKERNTEGTVYEALIRAINFQQLSGKSASAIHGRFLNLFPNQFPEPNAILSFTDEELKSVGLSRQKMGYIRNVAQFFIDKNLIDFDWETLQDQEILDLLTQIKGIGNWTVEMVLMFTLNRPDVLPLDDLVVKNGIVALYNLEEKGKALNQKILEIAENWRPYRTTASLYFWQWNDTIV